MINSSTWLKNQIKSYMVPPRPDNSHSEYEIYDTYQKLLEEILKKAKDIYSPMALVSARAKQPDSFAEKCLRKMDKYKNPIFQLTDLCGALQKIPSLMIIGLNVYTDQIPL